MELFSSNLLGNLAYIKLNFGGLSTKMSRLEAIGAEMHDAFVLVKGTVCEVGCTWQSSRSYEIQTSESTGPK
jgi:hypothetical protein